MSCSCQDFEKLVGASVNGYIAAFLEADKAQKNRFTCRVCGTNWEKHAPAGEVSKSYLVKTETNQTDKSED
jgi:hypothetical protein